jgi:ABC-2 type transport system permease protein
MTSLVRDTWYMTGRQVRNLTRQPYYIVLMLAQPIIYLLLFGALFERIVQLPGFGAGSYMTFLAPGIVVMSALFTGGWSGMGLLNGLDLGVLDRFLVTPVRRSAVVSGQLVQLAATVVIQATILLVLAALRGAAYDGGLPGLLVLVLAAILVAVPFGALSCGAALVMRKQESVIAAVNMLILPLTFLSSAYMAKDLMPDWIRTLASINPVEWAVEAARAGVTSGSMDVALVASRLGALAIFALVTWLLATRAFRSYQRSI